MMDVLTALMIAFILGIEANSIQKEKCMNNGGTEFSVIFLENIRSGEPLRLYLNTNSDQHVQVEITTPTWISLSSVNVNANVTSENTTVVDLPEELRLQGNVIDHKVVRVIATDVVFLHASNIQSSSGDAYIVYPLSVTGTEYLVPTTEESDLVVGVVAHYDHTIVHVQLPVGTQVEVNGTVYQMEFVATLNWFEVLHLHVDPANYILVKSDKDVSVNGGHIFEVVQTILGTSGDHTEEQLLPISFWSNEYIVAPALPYTYSGYGENVKIYAYYNGTSVEISYSSTKTVVNLAVQGDMHKFNIKSGEAVMIKSNMNIGVFQYGVASPDSNYPSDSYLLQVSGTDQYVQSVTFPTFLTSSNVIFDRLMLVSTNNAKNSIFLNNELLVPTWKSLGNTGYSFTYINITESRNILNTSDDGGLFNAVLSGVDHAIQYGLAVGKYLIPSRQSISQDIASLDVKMSKFGQLSENSVPLLPSSYTGPDSIFQCLRICTELPTCDYVAFNSNLTAACRIYKQRAYCSHEQIESGSDVYYRYV